MLEYLDGKEPLQSLAGIVDRFSNLNAAERWGFRGQADAKWPLRPVAGRRALDLREDLLLNSFERLGAALIDPHADRWHRLALAQHHGLATRLLDWSRNLLAAVFFAVEALPGTDAAIYAFNPADWREDRINAFEPFSGFNDVLVFRPKLITPRIGRQGAFFTVHPFPEMDLRDALSNERPEEERDILHSAVIKGDCKRRILYHLMSLGIDRYSLFPDLDGLSSYINWMAYNMKSLEAETGKM